MSEENYQESIKRIDKNISEIRTDLKQTRKDFAKIIAEMKKENRQRQILLEKENIKRDANIDKIESVYGVAIDDLKEELSHLITYTEMVFGALGFLIAILEFFRG